jgi:hypothetical protein
VEDGVEGLVLNPGRCEDVFESLPIGQFALDEVHSRRQQIAPAVTQIVENDCLVALLGKEARNSTSNVPRPARHKNLHKKTTLASPDWFTLSL